MYLSFKSEYGMEWNGMEWNTNYYGTTFGGIPGSFNLSQINACVVGLGVLGPRFNVSSEGLGLRKMSVNKDKKILFSFEDISGDLFFLFFMYLW